MSYKPSEYASHLPQGYKALYSTGSPQYYPWFLYSEQDGFSAGTRPKSAASQGTQPGNATDSGKSGLLGGIPLRYASIGETLLPYPYFEKAGDSSTLSKSLQTYLFIDVFVEIC